MQVLAGDAVNSRLVMVNADSLHTHTEFAKALFALLSELSSRIELRAARIDQQVDVYLAGGMAVHLYTGNRVTTDVDAEFAARIAVPEDLVVEAELEDGSKQPVFFDTNYNPMFALMHEDYQTDSIQVREDLGGFRLMVLSPLDLAVSKIARFADNDREDIQALASLGLFTGDELSQRAEQALTGFVGGHALVKVNIDEAVRLVAD